METKVTATTTTTTTTASTGVGINFNPLYFIKTVPGILKLIQLLFGIICMGCASPVLTSYTHFFMFVVATCFITTILLCLIYLFSVQELAPNVPWLFMELSYTGGALLMYSIATIVQLAMSSRSDYHYVLRIIGYLDAYLAAGCFGVFNVLAYGAGLFFLYRDWRQSQQVAN